MKFFCALASLIVVSQAACNKETLQACKASFADLPACSAEVKPAFDREKCCTTCRPALPVDITSCNKAKFMEQLKDLRECEADESPLTGMTCGPSCKRPQRKCHPRQVAQCVTKAEKCAAGKLPTFAQGKCCPECVPTLELPKCDAACENGQVCAWSKDGPKCRGKKAIKFLMQAKDEAKKFLEGATPEEIRATLVEIATRYCERAENKERCDAHLENIITRIEVAINKEVKVDGGISVTVNVPEDAATTRRRLLADDSASLLESALKDTEAAGEITMGEDQGGSASSAFASMALVGGLAGLVLAAN